MVSAPQSSVDDEIPAESFHTPPDEVIAQSQSSDDAKDTDSHDNYCTAINSKDIDFVDTSLFLKNSQGTARVLEAKRLELLSSKKSKSSRTSVGFKSPAGESNLSSAYLGLKFSDSRCGNVSGGKSKLSSTCLGFKSLYPLFRDEQRRISASNVVNSCENLENTKDTTTTVDCNGSDDLCANSFLDEDHERMNIDILVDAALHLERSHNMKLVDAGEHRSGMHQAQEEAENGAVDGDEGGLRNNIERNDVSIKENVDGRQLPSSFRDYECGLESEFGRRLIPPQKSWVNSVHEIFNALSKGREGKMIDDNVFHVAMNHGVRFPRPRWWRRDGYGKGIEDGLKTDSEEAYKFDTNFVPLDTNDSLLQDC